MFIKVHFKNKSIFCGTVYRPLRQDKNSIDSFNDSLHYVLNNINKTKNKCIISGDFNFNLLDSLDHYIDTFVETMFSFNYYPLINKPTRITEKSNSTIDHIWTNFTNTKISSGIIVHRVADHLPIFQTSVVVELSPFQKNVMQCFSPQYLLQFQRSIKQVDFTTVFQESDPDQSYAQFDNLINDKVKICFTLKCSKNRPNSVNGMTKNLQSY